VHASGWWIGARRPLFAALVLGCAVSLIVSGTTTVRLIAGGALAWSFVPAFDAAAFAVVRRRARRATPFSRDLDLACATHRPWLLWLVAVAGLAAFATPQQTYDALETTAGLTTLVASLAAAAAWSACIDFRFYRTVFERTRSAAVTDLLLHRAMAWTACNLFFWTFVGWPLVADRLGL